MKVYRYIAIVLLICFSAFLGHNLVPHHHHSEALANPISSDCPIQHEDHHGCDQDKHQEGEEDHADDHPIHCHAFNDVVFEKFDTREVKPLIGYLSDLTVSHADLLPDPLACKDFYFFDGLKIPPKTIELCGTRDLRGPPKAA